MTRYPSTGKNTKWTIKELKAIKPDWKGDTLADSEGLSGEVRVNSSMKVSIRFKYAFRWEDKVCWYYCGTFPAIDLAAIRQNRDKARELIKQGIDPRVEKKASKIEAQAAVEAVIKEEEAKKAENLTVNDLYEVWILNGVARKDGNEALSLQINKHVLPVIGSIPLRELTEQNLLDLYRSIVAQDKIRTSDAVAKTMKQMLKWAEKRQPYRRLLIEGNPTELVNMQTVLPEEWDGIRNRILSDNEIRKLHEIFITMQIAYDAAAQKYSVRRPVLAETQLAIWICLSTICRIGELMLARWEHVDLDKRIWFIPARNTKGKRGKRKNHYVYLSDFALSQFTKLKSYTGKTEWLFPSTNKKNEVGPLCEKSITKQIGDRQCKFKKHTKSLKNRAISNDLVIGNEEWTPHDLRRTGSTIMQRLRIQNEVVNRCQNHAVFDSKEKINLHYLHYDFESEMIEAWGKLGAELEKILASC